MGQARGALIGDVGGLAGGVVSDESLVSSFPVAPRLVVSEQGPIVGLRPQERGRGNW